ncbi:SMa0974 family conjugal transfer regulator [Rhizobium sullae]|uniref:SMa0974 family conjugal transfer regulator n=1 Tax=Rhizobium sullae TaxID=50338 RepID=UPI000B358506
MATNGRSTFKAETHRNAAESYILASNPCDLVEQITLPISHLARRVNGNGTERTLVFDEGKAIVRGFEGGLLLWVCASTLVVRHALQILLESSLFLATSEKRLEISWYPSVGKPFAVVEGLLFCDASQRRPPNNG